MKKKDIIQLVKETVKENTFYGNREQPSQLSTGTKVSVPTDEYPFSAKPKRTGTGMMEDESTSFKVVNADTGKTIDFGLDQAKAEEIVALAKEDNINAKVVKMKNVDDVGKLKESQGTLASDMLNYADQYHMELVDTMKGVSTHPDKRTGGFYIKFPHENGPGPGALFGKEVRLQIEKSKAAAKAAAQKTVSKFQNQIEDYEISDSKSGVYGNVWLWVMPKSMDENKEGGMRELSQEEINAIYNNFPEIDNFNYKGKEIIDDPDGDMENATLKITTSDGKSYKVLTSSIGNERWWEIPKTEHMGENKELSDNPKLQPGKTVIYSGTKYEVIENSGYVLTLKSLESGKELKINLGQLKDRPIKENNMKKNIKEADLYTLTSTDGEEKQVSFPDQNTAMAAASKNANVKQVVKLEGEDDSNLEQIQKGKMVQLNKYFEDIGKMKLGDGTIDVGYAKMDLVPGVKENTPDDDEDEENQSQDDIAMGVDDAKDFMEAYIKERGDSNLMEHMDKYRKRARLMEGATEKLFKLFNAGKTDLEVRSHYLQMNVDMPESFIAKLRNNWESLRKTKLDLTLADKEAEGFEAIQQAAPVNGMEGGEIDGMEENKELASGLFTK